MADIVKTIFEKLPQVIEFEGITFQMQIFINHTPYDMRLVYAIDSVSVASKHYFDWKEYELWYNGFFNTTCSFLVLYEGIENEKELYQAINNCNKFLLKHKFI